MAASRDERHGKPADTDAGDADNTPRPPSEPADTSPEDQVLIRQMLAGDQDAFRSLVNRYDRLIRYAIFRAGQRYCARDPGWLDARANEAWTGIVQSLRRIGARNLPPNISAYFSQIARNKCLDAIRQADSRRVIPFETDGGRAGTPDQPDPSLLDPAALLENLEEVEALRECMAKLREEDQVICAEIGLIAEKRWKEAAERLGIAESTLRSRWLAVIGRLRGCLEHKIENKFAPPGGSADS